MQVSAPPKLALKPPTRAPASNPIRRLDKPTQAKVALKAPPVAAKQKTRTKASVDPFDDFFGLNDKPQPARAAKPQASSSFAPQKVKAEENPLDFLLGASEAKPAPIPPPKISNPPQKSMPQKLKPQAKKPAIRKPGQPKAAAATKAKAKATGSSSFGFISDGSNANVNASAKGTMHQGSTPQSSQSMTSFGLKPPPGSKASGSSSSTGFDAFDLLGTSSNSVPLSGQMSPLKPTAQSAMLNPLQPAPVPTVLTPSSSTTQRRPPPQAQGDLLTLDPLMSTTAEKKSTTSKKDASAFDFIQDEVGKHSSKEKSSRGPLGDVGPAGDEAKVSSSSSRVRSSPSSRIEFADVPCGGDCSYVNCVLESIKCGLVCLGMGNREAENLGLLMRWSIARSMESDLDRLSGLDASAVGFASRQLVLTACRHLAFVSAKQARLAEKSGGVEVGQLFQIKRTINSIRDKMAKLATRIRAPQELPPSLSPQQSTTLALDFTPFHRFRRDMLDVEPLAGSAARPPIYRPVEMSKVGDSVVSFHDVAIALRQCCLVCTKLSYQGGLIKNTFCLRVGLITNLFTRVIPLPLAMDHPQRAAQCFWAGEGREMRYETQVDLLRLLSATARHFCACAMSLQVSRSFDATRILTLACMATIADAVLRKEACDVPSTLSLHYSGRALGPLKPFGVEMRQFATESALFLLPDPAMMIVRTQVLDYFHAQQRGVDEAHTLFKWEQAMECSSAEEIFIDQICLDVGYPRPASFYGLKTDQDGVKEMEKVPQSQLLVAAQYITGERKEIISDFPEFAHFRDLIFLLKLMMAPTADSLPVVKAWAPADALLSWTAVYISPKKGEASEGRSAVRATIEDLLVSAKPATAKFKVSGFGGKVLECEWAVEDGEATWYRSLLAKMKRIFFKQTPRAPPSMANPSFLLGHPIEKEEDVLHLTDLPDFDGRLTQKQTEILAQILTVPYMRIPLVLQFFSPQSRTLALTNPDLRQLLDCVCFEPGEWQPGKNRVRPEMIPDVDPDSGHGATPLGLLFNELRHAPMAVVAPVETMLNNVLDVDAGRWSPSSSPAALYVIKLFVRVKSFINALLEFADWHASETTTTRTVGATYVRGIECPPALAKELRAIAKRWRVLSFGKVLPMLSSWLRKSSEALDLETMCVLQAHIAYVFKEIDWRAEDKDKQVDFFSQETDESVTITGLAARTLLCSQVFLTASHRVDIEPRVVVYEEVSGGKQEVADEEETAYSSRAPLGLDELELFAMFARHRCALLRWLEDHPEQRSEIMEHTVRVLINEVYKGIDPENNYANGNDGSVTGKKDARKWESLREPDCLGRYVPETEMKAISETTEAAAPESYEDYLRGRNKLDTEINIQLGEFTLKKHRVEPIDEELCDFADFNTVFGDRVGLQSAEVNHTTHRRWIRLVGRRHDLQLWDAGGPPPSAPFCRVYPAQLQSHERWVVKVMSKVLQKLNDLPDVSIDLFVEDVADAHRLSDGAAVRLGAMVTLPDGLVSVKEIVLFRFTSPPVIHLYDVIQYGRRDYASLVFTTDAGRAYRQLVDASLGYDGVRAHLLRPIPRLPSLLVTRNLNVTMGKQLHVPDRLLYGVIPEALIEEYIFWQHEGSDDLTGYQRRKHTRSGAAKDRSQLRIKLTKVKAAFADARIVRYPLAMEQAKAVSSQLRPAKQEEELLGIGASEEIDPDGQAYVLVDMLRLGSAEKGPLRTLCDLLLRLDNLTHILVWAKCDGHGNIEANSSGVVDLIELPRLNLSFSAKPDLNAGHAMRFFCNDHAGFFISDTAASCTLTQALLRGIPHGVLLENANDRTLSILLPAIAKPCAKLHQGAGGFDAPELVLDRCDETWLRNLRDPRSRSLTHYLYPIHSSRSFLFTPTLASALYLILLRLISGNFDLAFRLADFCVADTQLSPDEDQLVEQLFEIQRDDVRTDAIACRLKLILVTSGTPMSDILNWNPATELAKYLNRLEHVSGNCRLTKEEEILLLELQASDESGESFLPDSADLSLDTPVLVNRINYLHKLDAAAEDQPFTVQVLAPQQQAVYAFDAVLDTSALDLNDGMLKKMAVLSYSRPKDEELQNIPALLKLDKWTRAGRMRLRGGKDDLGFLFLYELMTEQVPLRVLSTDSPYNWGALLLRLLPRKDTAHTDALCSMLRILAANRHLAPVVPKFEDVRRFKISTIFRGQNVLQRLLQEFSAYASKHKKKIHFPPRKGFRLYEPPMFVQCAPPARLLGSGPDADRMLVAARIPDYACAERELHAVKLERLAVSMDELEALATCPISFQEEYVTRNQANALSTSLPFTVSVEDHPNARSYVAKQMYARLREDVRHHANADETMWSVGLKGFSSAELGNLQDAGWRSQCERRIQDLQGRLRQLLERDEAFTFAGTAAVLRLANQINPKPPPAGASSAVQEEYRKRIAVLFARSHGQESTIWFALLIGTMLSSKGFKELVRINPFLTEEHIRTLEDAVAALMLRINRAGQISRCMAACTAMLELLSQAGEEKQDGNGLGLEQEMALMARELAAQLSAKRSFITIERDMQGKTMRLRYDPRLLVFEFMQNIVLRKSQVELIEQFKVAIAQGSSRCHQMLMGAGKTTVVAPILALLLGDGQRLVVQVVPRELFQFSCSVMRMCFSAVLQKQVYTFRSDRFTTPSAALYQKLLKARAARGIVVAIPTAIKSFTLKFVETVNAIQELKAAIESGKDTSDLSLFALLGRRFNLNRSFTNEQEKNQSALAELQRQAQLCVRVLSLFRFGSLILDEVDLILHPLKSELNWPMGRKEPLDFTRSKGMITGWRWNIPFHLIDAIFFAGKNAKLTVQVEENREARRVLKQLRSTLDEGCETKLVQRKPHIVVVSKPFYHERIKPLLARWYLVWLNQASNYSEGSEASSSLDKVSQDDLYAYLMEGNQAATGIASRINNLLADEHLKMLNLGHDWLKSFLPHVLHKVNRVHFGLLNLHDLQVALKRDPNMPESRKLLAVPFVGKDVPSTASEFAHPDVVIGLAILAYRYEGLRFTDFVQVITELRARVETETGPFPKRKACKLFIKWVERAGGKVRGIRGKEKEDDDEDNLLVWEEKEEEELQDVVRKAATLGAQRSDEEIFQDIWPLQLIDLQDMEQVAVLFRLLGKSAHVVEHYLNEYVFPVTCRHQGLKLSACGQALGGELLFRQRFGFSGTPSDLLPVELGKCHYEAGSDGKMVTLLTSPDVVTYQVLPNDWTVHGILDMIASASLQYHALLDTGALITGMSNIEVAAYLLKHGLHGHDGVVFLDESDRKMILLRHGLRVMDMSQCGVPKHRRFSFYDQIHTTGMDIKQALGAKAM